MPEMFKTYVAPPSYVFLQKGRTFLLLRENYRDLLLEQGIEDMEAFLAKHPESLKHLGGRTVHPSVSIRNSERMVVRRYSHGGLMRPLFRGIYFVGSRAFQELCLTEEIRTSGISTIQTLGAIHQRVYWRLYRAWILSREIPQARDMIQYLRDPGPHPTAEKLLQKRKIVRAAGLVLRQFHQSGFFHADLQLKNLLVVDDQVSLIDFDRSYRKPALAERDRIRNLLRLNRSVDKWVALGLPVTRTDRWRFFLAYAAEDQKIRTSLRKALFFYSVRLLFHRLGWKIQRKLQQRLGN